jgi:hypothetical protein
MINAIVTFAIILAIFAVVAGFNIYLRRWIARGWRRGANANVWDNPPGQDGHHGGHHGGWGGHGGGWGGGHGGGDGGGHHGGGGHH